MSYKKLLISHLFIILLIFNANAQIPSGYYNNAEGLSGYTLKTALHNIIKNHNDRGYDALYYGYETTDSDQYYENDGSVLDMYSENPNGSDPYNYTHGNNQCGNYSSESDCYNREHLFPQGFFNKNRPMRSDIHHVVPSDGKVNGMRGNLPFGETSTPTWTSQNGSKKGSCSYPGYNGTVFEPIDEFKGDIARALLYFVTRYENKLNNFNPNASNNPLDGSSDQAFEQWYVNLLIDWHQQDPVSQREIDRNNAAYNFQGNRNPFIDHPEWVECIWLNNCNALQFTSTPVTSAQEGQLYTYNITAQSNESNSPTINCTNCPEWLTFTRNGSANATLSGTPESSDVGNHSVSLELTDGNSTVNQNFNIMVKAAGNEFTLFNKDFEDQSLTSGGWESVSITGSQEWEVPTELYGHNDSHCATMGGYEGGSSHENEDWYISPAFNPNEYNGLTLSFWNTKGYTGPALQAFYCNEYTGDPATTSWTLIDGINWYDGTTFWTWTYSGDIDLSAITGTEARIGFKYTSSSSTAAKWELDDIKLDAISSNNSSKIKISDIEIYPNPISDLINIKGLEKGNAIKIFSADGKLILSVTASKSIHKININKLSKGLYILSVIKENTPPISKKFIKK